LQFFASYRPFNNVLGNILMLFLRITRNTSLRYVGKVEGF
jgi:hypothetical protein